MRQVDYVLAAAIDSPERTVRVRLSCDWDDDGHGPARSLDDLSEKVSSVTIASVLQGTQPDQVAVVEGTGAATLTADLVKGDTDDERLDAVVYFSVFNSASPLAGRERLNRSVECDVEFLTEAGWRRVPLLRGSSRRLPVRVAERKAELAAIDNRDRLRTPVTIPTISADTPQVGNLAPAKPGLEGSWVISFVLWKCGFPVSPPPPAGCRVWAPMHGSAMPFIGAPFTGSPVAYLDTGSSSDLTRLVRIEFDTGPYLLATALTAGSPSMLIDYHPAAGTPVFAANGRTKGRMTAWVETSTQVITVTLIQTFATQVAWYAGGTLTLTNNSVDTVINGPATPFDGGWHLVGVQWDDDVGRADFILDGKVTTVAFTPTTPGASSIVDDWIAQVFNVSPFAELVISTGVAFSDPWPPVVYQAPARVDRSALRPLDGIVGADPAEGWEILGELAAAEQGAVYLDADGVPVYATRARLVSTAAQVEQRKITATLHMFELAYDYDLDKIANVVTVPYQPIATAVQVVVWSLSDQTVAIPAGGTATLTASYSALATSVRLVSGTGNSKQDGTGTSYTIGSGSLPYMVAALSDTASTISIANKTGATVWLVNASGQPNVQMIGDQISQGTGAAPPTVTDEASRKVYHDRPITLASNRWIQRYEFAAGMAMVTARDLSRPQPVFAEIPIPGDPRIEPFDLLRVVDPDNTGIDLPVWYVGGTHTITADGQYVTSVVGRPARNRFLAGSGLAGIDLVG